MTVCENSIMLANFQEVIESHFSLHQTYNYDDDTKFVHYKSRIRTFPPQKCQLDYNEKCAPKTI